MRRIVLRVFFLLFTCFFISYTVDAQTIKSDNKKRTQIVQKQSNKKQLINGIEIVVKKNDLQLLPPTSVTPSSIDNSKIKPKPPKSTKPVKVSKYGRREASEIKREEDE